MKISLIAGMTHNRVIAKENSLPWNKQPADIDWFKSHTMTKPVVMGRIAFECLGRPLPGRRNLVVSRTQTEIDGVTVVSSLDTTLSQLQDTEEVVIIGAGRLADRLYLTFIDADLPGDTCFPLWCHKHFRKRFVGTHSSDAENENDMKFVILDKLTVPAELEEA